MVKLTKSGLWALQGVHVVEMTADDVKDFGAVDNCALVAAGWAEWVKVLVPKHEVFVEAPDVVRRGPGRPAK